MSSPPPSPARCPIPNGGEIPGALGISDPLRPQSSHTETRRLRAGRAQRWERRPWFVGGRAGVRSDNLRRSPTFRLLFFQKGDLGDGVLRASGSVCKAGEPGAHGHPGRTVFATNGEHLAGNLPAPTSPQPPQTTGGPRTSAPPTIPPTSLPTYGDAGRPVVTEGSSGLATARSVIRDP